MREIAACAAAIATGARAPTDVTAPKATRWMGASAGTSAGHDEAVALLAKYHGEPQPVQVNDAQILDVYGDRHERSPSMSTIA
jgi:hypothetical protein